MIYDKETHVAQNNNTSAVGPEDVESKKIDAYKERALENKKSWTNFSQRI